MRQLKRQEEYRSSMESRKAAPVVALFAGSLTGVTAPMWHAEYPSGTKEADANRKMEFGSYDDCVEYKRKKNLLRKFRGTGKKISVLMRAVAGFDSSGKTRAERRDEGEGDPKKGAAPEATAQSQQTGKATAAAAAAAAEETQPPTPTEEFEASEWDSAVFDCSPPSPSES